MAERRPQRMIRGIVHDVAKEPYTRTFFEVRIVESSVSEIAIGPCRNRIDDVRSV